jgi:hypothetical protein
LQLAIALSMPDLLLGRVATALRWIVPVLREPRRRFLKQMSRLRAHLYRSAVSPSLTLDRVIATQCLQGSIC